MNKIKNNKFSHFGSTKDIKTQLNSSYIQVCLSQVCASLNNYTANINTKFAEFINNSSIKDRDLLHKLRTINSKLAWLNNIITYYPELTRYVTDDFGNIVEVKYKQDILIDKDTIRLARIIYKHIVDKSRVRFPNVSKPKLILDSRLFELEHSKTKSFDYWLKITTLIPGKRISIPIKKNKFFSSAIGVLGNTVELDFKSFDYNVIQHKHNSLSKPKKSKIGKSNINKIGNIDKEDINKLKINKLSKQGLIQSNKQVRFIFNKKQLTEDITANANEIKKTLTKTVAFDLGLCNLIATDSGELFGKYWLTKLTRYDKQITTLLSARQACLSKYNNENPTNKLTIRSKRYDKLITQVKGFIKTEINRILNKYFAKNKDIQTVVIEKLRFSSPELSRRLNRIIQNFGLKLYKAKLEELSLYNGFKIEELNPAYTSQECSECGYVDSNNRSSQSMFKCKCCGQKMNADVQGSRTNVKRFNNQSSAYKTLNKGTILNEVKVDFVKGINYLVINGKVGRRNLYQIMSKNKYYEHDIKIVKTTEASGVEPMTVNNFDKLLNKHYQSINKI